MTFFFICAVVFLGLMTELHASQPSFFRQTAHQRGLIAQKSVPFSKVGRVDYSLIDRSLLNKENISPASALSRKLGLPATAESIKVSFKQKLECSATAATFLVNKIAIDRFVSTVAPLLDANPRLLKIGSVVDDSASAVKQNARIRGDEVKNEIVVSYTVEYPSLSVVVGVGQITYGSENTMDLNIAGFVPDLEAALRTVPGFSDLIALPPTVTDVVAVDANSNPIAQPNPPDSSIPADPKTNSANGVESTSSGGVIGGICGGLAFMIGVGYYSYHQQRLKQTKEVTADAKIGDAAIAKAIGAGDVETANPVHSNTQAEIEMGAVTQ